MAMWQVFTRILPTGHLALGLSTLPRTHAIVERLQTTLATAQAELYDAIGVFRPVEDAVMLYSQADDLPWFARQLARVSFHFEVIEPPELLEAIETCAQRLLGQVKPPTE